MNRKLFIDAVTSVLELPDGFDLRPETVIAGVPGWDSMGWIKVIAAIEDMSGREFPTENIEDVVTVEDLYNAMHRLK